MSNGVVVDVGGPAGDSGNYVVVKADDGRTQWSFSHMRESSRARVGERVNEGAVLGVVGMTGHTTGPHVHVTTRVGGVRVDPETLTDPARRGVGDDVNDTGGGWGIGPFVAAGAVGFLVWKVWRA